MPLPSIVTRHKRKSRSAHCNRGASGGADGQWLEKFRNVGASVRARLQHISREMGQSFELILTRYSLERLLYRLGTSAYAGRFMLRGAMLLTSWFEDPYRT